jgi:hypothetical protein
MTGRRSAAVLFLALLALGVVWPALAGTVRCGDCCGGSHHAASSKRSNPCGIPATGFSLCCFHSVSTPPAAPLPRVALAEALLLPLVDEEGGPPPAPRGVLHVPKPA